MKRGTYVLIIFLIFFVVIMVSFFTFLYFEFGKPPKVQKRSYLEIPLSGQVFEKSAPDLMMRLFLGTEPLAMHDLWMNIRKAKVDSRIRSLVLRLGYLECDWAKIHELRDLVLDFRQSGKKVYAYIEETVEFDKEYYLATACDEIILHPLGSMVINGIGGYVPFVKNSLDKMGIQAEFEHVEEYKTAAAMFTEEGFTETHREMMESIYGSLFQTYIQTVAEARRKSVEDIRELIDQAFFQGEEALEAGLVDRLLFEDELAELVKQDEKKLNKIGFATYLKIKPSSLGLNKGKKIALIYGMGPIHTGEGYFQTMGSKTIARWIRSARNDKSVKAVVLRVDSPGGSAVASDVIWREVALTKSKKPVVVSMSDVAGSGGYWISMGASKIVAQPQTLTGSIGVLAGKFNMSELYEKLGITAERLVYGEKADMFSTFRGLTDEERALLKREIVWIYERFLAKAAEGRSLSVEEVNRIGRGRVWTGQQAKELGLVDELGGLSKAIQLAKELAGIPGGEEVKLAVRPKKMSFFDILFGQKTTRTELNLNPLLERWFSTFKLLEKERVWALMPVWLPAE